MVGAGRPHVDGVQLIIGVHRRYGALDQFEGVGDGHGRTGVQQLHLVLGLGKVQVHHEDLLLQLGELVHADVGVVHQAVVDGLGGPAGAGRGDHLAAVGVPGVGRAPAPVAIAVAIAIVPASVVFVVVVGRREFVDGILTPAAGKQQRGQDRQQEQ